MPDPVAIVSGIAAVKTTLDAFRAAIGLLRETKDLLPNDEKTAPINAALAAAESSSRIAEAEIAKALGYELCKCEFPPTPMLTVGYHTRPTPGYRSGSPVFECPKCGITSAGPYMYERTAPERENPPAAPAGL
jgi:hypothetical protein